MTAVGTERISKIVGYTITKGNFSNTTPNLPQRIAILAEANEANQATLDTDPQEITSAQQAGELYGYGSPIHSIMRILRPASGGGVGGVPTVVYAQAKAGSAAAKEMTLTVTGTATGNGTHTVKIAGRTNVDGEFYNFTIATGDTAADIAAKIADAINAVLGSPVTASANLAVVTLTSKWNGLTADSLTAEVDNNDTSIGVTYAVVSTQSGAGTPSVQAALEMFGSTWNTIVINSYGTETTTMGLLETFNGIPDPNLPTGRYSGIVMKPFIALTGSVAEDPSSVTDSRKAQVTIEIAPAPLSKGLPYEAAANMAVLRARIAQDTPHLDVSGQFYPDMPTPSSIGDMSDYENRDAIVKKGCTTVDLVNGRYRVMDSVTTYHPQGEVPPQFRYTRNLMLDWNIRFGYYLLEQIHVVDHAIAGNNDTVSAASVIKPKQWVQVLQKYADDLSQRALITDPDFMKDSLEVDISSTNPDRLETFFRYKRTGYARISSTTAEAGFNFGS